MEQTQIKGDGFEAWAGVAGVALVLTMGLAALWATGEPEPPSPAEAARAPAEALYGDEGGAHDTTVTPTPAPPTATSLFDAR